jgi:iron complex outermembrane receptor protein
MIFPAKSILALISGLVLAVSFSLAAADPLPPAQFHGRVVSPDGSGLPGAKVSIREVNTGRTVEVIAGAMGMYRATGLQPGAYEVRVEANGFDPRAVTDLTLSAGEAQRVDFSLPPATVQEFVTVVAAAPKAALQASEARESAARDIGEALTRATGVWKIRKGGIANDIILRGFASKDLNVLIDGQRVCAACPNTMDPPAFHVDFAEVDRVETAKGPFDIRNMGSLGGIVNIITRSPASGFHGAGNLSSGAYGFYNPSLSLSYGADAFTVLGGFSYRGSKPYTDGSGKNFTDISNYRPGSGDLDSFRVGTGWAKVSVSPFSNHELQLAYTRQEADDVLYPYLMMDAIYDNTDRVNLGYEIERPWRGVQAIRVQSYFTQVKHWMTDEFRTSSFGLPKSYSMGTTASTDALGGKFETDLGKFLFGVEAFRRGWKATTQMAGMAYRAQNSIPDVDTTSIGIYADYRQILTQRLSLTVGGRLDRARMTADEAKANTNLYFAYNSTRSNSANDTLPSAQARLSYLLPTGWEFQVGVGHTERVPDARERYFALQRKGSDWVGNPDLKPSRNTGVDAAVLFRKSALLANLTFYYYSVDDFVTVLDRAKVSPIPGIMNSLARSYENVDARMYGSEFQAGLSLTRHFSFSTSISYVRGKQTAIPAEGIVSTNLAEIPPLSARAQLRFDNGQFWAEAEGVFAAAQNQVNADLQESTTPGYGIANVRLGLNVKGLRLWVGLNNVFDGYYAEHMSFQRDPFRSGVRVYEPGRNFFLNIEYRI